MNSGELRTVPTPDDGVRRSKEQLWDEATRPRSAAPDPDRRYTEPEQLAGRRLIEAHDYLRKELTQLRDLVAQVVAGTVEQGFARARLHAMTLRPGNTPLHGYCQAFCRIVVVHHLREDSDIFPELAAFEPGLVPVLDRLVEEHGVIHAVVERLDRVLATQPLDVAGLDAAVAALTDTLLSHLSYEEQELTEPLARFWGKGER